MLGAPWVWRGMLLGCSCWVSQASVQCTKLRRQYGLWGLWRTVGCCVGRVGRPMARGEEPTVPTPYWPASRGRAGVAVRLDGAL